MMEQMAGLSKTESGGGGYLVLSQQVAVVMAAWIHASARKGGDTWIPKYQRSLFFASGRGATKPPGWWGFRHMPLDPRGWSLAF